MAGPVSLKTYKLLAKYSPIVSNDVLIRYKDRYLLLKRVNKPAKGLWWTPGSRVYKQELITASASRVARQELGIKKIAIKGFFGVFQVFCFPGKFGLKSTNYFSFAFLAEPIGKFTVKIDSQHSDYKFFKKAPSGSHAFIKRLFYLAKKKSFKATPPSIYKISG